ncbi:MAG: hypothetical protein N3C60_05950 [Calditerrivibrio sp.]|nr:hypothetical protein [Calditerrivibrio sp.]
MYKILIITPFFPPVESVATNRMVAFCRYLKDFKIYVVTISKDRLREELFGDNIEVLRIPDRSIFKKATFDRKTNIFFHNLKAFYNHLLLYFKVDEYSGWGNNVVKYLYQNKISVDVVLTSFAPISSHLVGLWYKKNNRRVCWVADMRDQMSSNIFFPERYRQKIKPYEAEILQNADIVSAVSWPIIDELRQRYPDSISEFIEIRNGYDFDIKLPVKTENDVWTVTYTGTFYGKRNPENFLKAIKEMVLDGLIDDIRINFVGVTKPLTVDKVLSGKVNFYEKVPGDQALAFMMKSDALLLIHPTTELKGIYTGKLFEYIGMLKPIIALVDPDDVAAKLIKEGNFGFVVDNDDMDGIRKAIQWAYDVFKGLDKFSPNIELAKSCHRRYQVEKLNNAILNKIETLRDN